MRDQVETAAPLRAHSPPRALVVVSATYADGGIQRFNRTFLTACDQLGMTSEVLSLGDSLEVSSSWSEPSSTSVRVFNHNKPRFALEVFAKILSGDHEVIVVGHINLLWLVAAATRVKRKARVILIAHGIEVWTGLTGVRARALRAVDTILCVSRYTRQAIESQVPQLADERFTIFPNALSESWRSITARSSLELPPRFILSVTRMDRGDRYKGIPTVLEALSMVEDDSLQYIIAGRGNDVDFIKGVAERLGVAHRVLFVGSVPDSELATLYNQCLAFVLPSAKEGFGIVFLEAMYFGACVIAASEKGAVDVVQHESTGLLVPYGDTAALKTCIDRVAANPILRRKLAEAGRATVIDDGAFTFRSYVRRLERTLNLTQDESRG